MVSLTLEEIFNLVRTKLFCYPMCNSERMCLLHTKIRGKEGETYICGVRHSQSNAIDNYSFNYRDRDSNFALCVDDVIGGFYDKGTLYITANPNHYQRWFSSWSQNEDENVNLVNTFSIVTFVDANAHLYKTSPMSDEIIKRISKIKI